MKINYVQQKRFLVLTGINCTFDRYFQFKNVLIRNCLRVVAGKGI